MVRQHGRGSRQDNADRPAGDVRGCRLRQAQKLSPDSSGSIATSRAASRHNSAGVRRRPSSSKMRTSFRLRASSARTCSRAALALAWRSTTLVKPAPEVTVNFMARLASPSCSIRKTPRRGSFDAGRSSTRLLEDKRPAQKFALDVGGGQFDIKVDAVNRPPSPRIPFKHHFRSGQILAPFLLVGDNRQHGHSRHAILEAFRLHALPSRRHRSLANFCRISSDIGLAHLVVQCVRHERAARKPPRRLRL